MLDSLGTCLHYEACPPGTVRVWEGEPGDRLHMLKSGTDVGDPVIVFRLQLAGTLYPARKRLLQTARRCVTLAGIRESARLLDQSAR
jgi:hypothetical protein